MNPNNSDLDPQDPNNSDLDPQDPNYDLAHDIFL
jgi:hypothetical protein